MAIKDKLEQEDVQEGTLSKEEKQHLSIMVNLAKNLIDDGGVEVINAAQKSRDPGQVIGQFLLQLGSQISEQLAGKVDISPKILLIEDGWVEQVSDYLQDEYGVSKDVMDRAEIYVGGMAQQQALAAEQNAAAPAEAQQPVALPQAAPQQGVM